MFKPGIKFGSSWLRLALALLAPAHLLWRLAIPEATAGSGR